MLLATPCAHLVCAAYACESQQVLSKNCAQEYNITPCITLQPIQLKCLESCYNLCSSNAYQGDVWDRLRPRLYYYVNQSLQEQ